MLGARYGLVLMLSFCGAPAWGQSSDWITIGENAFGFHEEIFKSLRFKIEPFVVQDSEILVELIGINNSEKINALGLQIRRVYGLNNAASLYGQNFRTIVFDPDWAARNPADFYLVLGHEAGHLFCRHVEGLGPANSSDKELEADRFGGAAIKRVEAYRNEHLFDAVVAAAFAKYPEGSSRFYPSRAMRIAALKLGYLEGSPCGDLAPVTQNGFVPPSGIDGGNGDHRPPSRCRPVRTGPTSYACARP